MPITLRSSSSRRDIIIVASIILLITIVLSYRTIFTEHSPWRRPVGDLPNYSIGVTKAPPTETTVPPKTEIELEKEKITVVTTATTTTTTTTPSAVSTIFYTHHSMPTGSPVSLAGGCEGFPDTKDILVVMKTGATEAYDKLPIHFLTTLACNNDTILFSDMDMNMAGHHINDALDEIAPEISEGNGDFDLYRLLQEYHRLGEDPRSLKEGPNGWNLDKYKFIHMLRKTYRYRPDVPWYVFIEADTTLIWDNLRTFLNEFDPLKEKLYIGSPTWLGIQFAHGGTGYVISQAAMAAAVGKHPDIAEKWDKDVQGLCCGDAMIGHVLLEENIHMTTAWPMFNGEKPLTLPFSPSHWCQPVITMHHLTAQEVSQVYNFEKERKAQGITTPLIFMDIFNQFVLSSLIPLRLDWTNLSDDVVFTPSPDDPDRTYNGRKWSELSPSLQASPESADNCQKACEDEEDCFQWQHHDRECALHHSIRLGGSKKDAKSWVSGWKIAKINKFREEMKECKAGLDWTYHAPSR